MSAIAGVFGPAAHESPAAVGDMLGAMRHRASSAPETFDSSGARMAAARHDWESTVSGWTGPLIAADDDWVVAADATLYYLDDLRRHLRTAPKNAGTAALLLMALHRWGPRFARYIEGDYGIVALERRRGRVLLARDFGGRRTLHYALTGGSLVVASAATAVVRHPDVSAEYDRGFLATAASGIAGPGARTAFRDVAVVPGGSTLSIEQGRVSEVDRWTPPPMDPGWESEPPAAAIEQLRHLIIEASRERLADNGPTTVWMSGGWDSTAAFAAACQSLDDETREARPVLPISMTYPADDIGNEDTHIRALAERWRVPVRWIDVEGIPLIADSERRALIRDDPMPQPFESKMRQLSQLSRELGSRVVLDGFGGDQLFFSSSASLIADHLRFGRWGNFWWEWRNWRGSFREFARLALLPNMSPATTRWLGEVRGRPLAGFWDRGYPPWIVTSPAVEAELEPQFERRPDEGAAEFEAREGMCSSLMKRAVSWNVAFGLDEGVQLRAPLFDQRLVAFAASRPLSDRGRAGDGKRALRLAMKGLIPDSVLAARDRKTGTPGGYFRRQFQPRAIDEAIRLFGHGQSQLERLGLVDRELLLDAANEYGTKGVHIVGAILQFTLETERWLAVRERRP